VEGKVIRFRIVDCGLQGHATGAPAEFGNRKVKKDITPMRLKKELEINF
jgi:hypothetical protein